MLTNTHLAGSDTAAAVYVLQLCQHRQPRRDGARDGVRVHLQITAARTHTWGKRARNQPRQDQQGPHAANRL